MFSASDKDFRTKVRKLSRIDIIRQIPSQEILKLLPYLQYKEFSPGTRLIKQGEVGNEIFFIGRGSVEVLEEKSGKKLEVHAGGVVGEISVVTGVPRTATVTTKTKTGAWTIDKQSFLKVCQESPQLKKSFNDLIELRKLGLKTKKTFSPAAWTGIVLRTLEVKKRGLIAWQVAMFIGMFGWILLKANEYFPLIELPEDSLLVASTRLVFGFLILQGACEALIIGAEKVGSRLNWDGFISGTVGSILSTLPEFVVIWFLVQIDPLMAIVTAIVTIFNNSLAYAFYAFLLPKDKGGAYEMPKSLTIAGGEILIAGSAITLIIGLVMLVLHVSGAGVQLAGLDLLVVGSVLLVIYIYYLMTLIRYYREGSDDPNSLPPDPDKIGYDTKLSKIVGIFFIGVIGSYCGGEAVGEFAETALNHTHMGKIATSAILAFFAGISEYIIVYKSHRRGEMGIALSNVFGGMTQVMFLLLPFGLILIGSLGLLGKNGNYFLPISPVTLLLFLLLFPLFYTLHQYLEQDNRISNLGAAGMSGIYLLLLYFLFTLPLA